MMLKQIARDPAIRFWQGIFLGYAIFIGGPVLILLIFQSIPDPGLYDPLSVSDNSGVSVLISITGIMIYIIGAKELYLERKLIYRETNAPSRFLWILYGAYISFAIFVFLKSGKLNGGHWYENGAALYEQSISAVIVGNVENVLRVSMPAILLTLLRRRKITPRVMILIAAFTMLFELVVSSNRIIVLFWILGILLSFRHRLKKNLFIFIIISPIILEANQYFPIVRGLLWTNGASVNQFRDSVAAAQDARNNNAAGIDRVLGSAVEADNLNVMKFVMEYFPDRHDYFYGATFFLKGFAFVVPRALWPEKPPIFSTFVADAATGIKGLALNSTFIGEAYGNFGWMSSLILSASLFIVGRVCRLFRTDYARAASFFIALAAWRFDFSFLIISFTLLLGLEFFRRVISGSLRKRVPVSSRGN